jgi:hypothetical protein
MGRHKLAYKLKKPNKHHKYWRYTLSSDPQGRYISARTKIKYEADRIAGEAYDTFQPIKEKDSIQDFLNCKENDYLFEYEILNFII